MQISEIFYSLQGEGSNVGKPFVFVRFAFCDLSCSFCDETKHKTVQYEWTVEELLTHLQQFPAKYVCLTGGEPSLEDRNDLIWHLHRAGYYVSVETNGYRPAHIQEADWITYSPKDWAKIAYGNWFNELKLIVNQDVSWEDLIAIEKQTEQPIFLQPQTLSDAKESIANVHHVRDLILAHPSFRLSLQVQHYIHIA